MKKKKIYPFPFGKHPKIPCFKKIKPIKNKIKTYTINLYWQEIERKQINYKCQRCKKGVVLQTREYYRGYFEDENQKFIERKGSRKIAQIIICPLCELIYDRDMLPTEVWKKIKFREEKEEADKNKFLHLPKLKGGKNA